jgi:hypothetical protein
MLNQPVPRTVIAPTNPSIGAQSREVPVTGIGTLPYCPNCGRHGPMDCMTLGDGSAWPNAVVICGPQSQGGCGNYWFLSSRWPDNMRTLVPISENL